MIREDSPLRHPPRDLSRRQVLILDGIRYAADMAAVAYERLAHHLQQVAAHEGEPAVRDIATGMLDAWSIVDSAHRMRDLVANLPGLSNTPWKRLLATRTEDIARLRDRVQHQLGEVDGLLSTGGQLWGFVSWHELRNGRPTGRWHMMAAGADYVGDRWVFMGPATLPFPVPRDSGVNLLFDANLSPTLVWHLRAEYADSIHVQDVGLRTGSDAQIWEYAKANSLAIVSKDTDFRERAS